MINHQQKAYALARVLLGINFLLHGLTRIPKLEAFATGMVAQFQATLLPAALTSAFAHALPFAEAGIGLFILLGLYTRHALLAAGVVMGMLLFGTCLLEKWDGAGLQMSYALYIAALLFLEKYNYCAVYRYKN
ncbi:DoxX family protein [Deminuibacter soli]|uniref:DoxX family protein n=1 Tax=Deminuibacter soli TaxID=2291815 RepID=A0A3E1NKJ7_9BACT|nr:DoxX family protein [Deminuibacter soli]RFM28469.1 DoxX family protein [Deminuibacter soli]